MDIFSSALISFLNHVRGIPKGEVSILGYTFDTGGWWAQYYSSKILTEKEKEFLKKFKTEEEFTDKIPYGMKVNARKLTLKESVVYLMKDGKNDNLQKP